MTIPNIITFGRILLVPLFLYIFWVNPKDINLSMIILIIAGLSDILDGYLARKLNVVSNLGKIIDPIADKLIVIAALVSLMMIGRMPSWIVALDIIKEVVMLLGGSFLLLKKQRDLAANLFGKLGTFLLFMAILSQAFLFPGRSIITILAGISAVVALINYILMHFYYDK